MLRAQEGFRNELTLVGQHDAIGISIWDSPTSADHYSNMAYSRVLEKLMPTLSGKPVAQQYEVGVTTIMR